MSVARMAPARMPRRGNGLAVGARPPVVGRERELAQIEELLDAVDRGSGGLLLEGEPGIGKTTLWRLGVELARERGWRVLLAQPTEPEQDLSFAALADLLATTRSRFRLLPSPQRHALRAALLLEELPERPPDERLIGTALLTLLQRLAKENPVLLAVDDVQWLDDASAVALA